MNPLNFWHKIRQMPSIASSRYWEGQVKANAERLSSAQKNSEIIQALQEQINEELKKN